MFFLINREKAMNKRELENRLIEFSVNVIEWVDTKPKHPAIVHLKDQIIRSSTASALNYGEVQSAESQKDFIHKIGVVMKELRETQINLKIINSLGTSNEDKRAIDLIKENGELLAIFHKTLQTARTNLNITKKN